MEFFPFLSVTNTVVRLTKSGKTSKTEKQRRTRRLRMELLEGRQLLAAVTVPWTSSASYDQFTGGAPKIFGFGVDDGEPDANNDGRSDSSGIQKKPNFFGFDLPNTGFNIGGKVLGANANFSGKFGVEYGYYVNGGSASSLHAGTFSYDVQNTANANTFTINTGVNVTQGSLYTVSPKISGYVDLIARLNGNIAVTSGGGSVTFPAGPFGAWPAYTQTLPTKTWFSQGINVDAGANLISVNRQVRDALGNPTFVNGSPIFDGDIRVAGLSPSNKLSNVPTDIQKQYANLQAQEDQGAADLKQAQMELSIAQTPAQTQAAQAKIAAANTLIANATNAASALKLKLGEPGKNSYTLAAGETGGNTNSDPNKPKTGGGTVLTYSIGTADGPLLGLKADLGLGVAVGKQQVGLPLGSATITLPDVSLVDNTPDSFGVLSASTQDAAFQANTDLRDRLQLAKLDLKLGSLLGGEFSVDTGIGTLNALILQYTLTTQLNVTQSASLSPDSSSSIVKFKFVNPTTNAPVTVNAVVGGVTKTGVTEIQFAPGTPVSVTATAGAKVKVVPSMQGAYNFSNRIGLSTSFIGDPEALKASIGSLSVGPFWDPDPTTFATLDLGSLYNTTFKVLEKEVAFTSFEIGGPAVDLSLNVLEKPGTIINNGAATATSFLINITNNGPSAASGVIFTHALPTGFTFDASKSNTGSTVTGGIVSYNLGTLAAGASKNLRLAVNVTGGDAEGSFSTLEVKNNIKETNTANNKTTIRTLVQPQNAIIVDKAGDDEDPATLLQLTGAELTPVGNTTLRRAQIAAMQNSGASLIYIDLKNTGPLTIDMNHGELRFFSSVTIVNLNDIITLNGLNQWKLLYFGNQDKNDYKIVNMSFKNGNSFGSDSGYGGAVEIYDPDGGTALNRDTLTIINSEMYDNKVNLFDGFNFGGAFAAESANVIMNNVNFYNNQAEYGGALNLSNSVSTITNATFTNNVGLTGGAIENHASGPNNGLLTISNSTFTANNAPNGSAIYNHTFENDDPAAKANTKFFNLIFEKNIGNKAVINTQFSGVSVVESQGGSISDDDSPSLNGTGDKKNTAAGITLSATQIVEGRLGEVLGSLGVVHPFMGTPIKYTVNDARFEIVDTSLKLKNANSLSQSTTPTVTLTLTATDGVLNLTKTFTINVVKPPLAPTALFLSKTTLAENTAGAVIGTITVTDPNPGDTHTFTVNNSRFEILNKQLKLKAGESLDFETTPTVTLAITARDLRGLTFTKNVLITVTNVNEKPSSINLSGASLYGNVVAGEVGTVTATDPDKTSPTLTVSDARFEIVGGKLKLKAGTSINPVTEPSVNMNLTASDTGGLSLVKPIVVHVAPVVTIPALLNYPENAAATVISPTASIAFKAGQNFNKGRIQVSLEGATADDRLEIRHQGTAAGQISAVAGQLKFGNVAIGTYSGGVGTAPLIIDFTSTAATVAAAQVLLRNLTYRSLSNAPPVITRPVSFALTDGLGGFSAPATNGIKITATNDAPALTLSGSVNYKRGAAALAIVSGANLTDVDSADFATGKLTIQSSGANVNDVIAVGTGFSFSGTDVRFGTVSIGTRNALGGQGTTKLEITFKSTATLTIVKQLLQSITFRTSATAPAGSRAITISLTDGDGGTSNTVTRTVNVTL